MLPSNSVRGTDGISCVSKRLVFTKEGSTKQLEEPQSIKALNIQGILSEVKGTTREVGLEAETVLRRSSAHTPWGSMQPIRGAGDDGLLSLFSAREPT